MINRKHDLALVQQCKALAIHRMTIYRESKPVKQRQLDHMKLIDRIDMDDPAGGCQKVREYLIELGHPIGRRHCTTLFRKLGIHCIYRKPRTTIPHIGHKIYPYLLRHLEFVKPNQVWAMDITYIPMAKGFVYLTCVMDTYSRKKYYPVSFQTPWMRVSVLMRISKQFVCMGYLRLSIPIKARSLHPMRLLQQSPPPEQDSAWMEKVLGQRTF
jgi:hypothetical protein